MTFCTTSAQQLLPWQAPVIVPGNNANDSDVVWSSHAAVATSSRSQELTSLSQPLAASPCISAADILTAPLADIARWAAAGKLAQAPLLAPTADSQSNTSHQDWARPRVSAADWASARPQLQSSSMAYPNGLPSPRASPLSSPVALNQLDAKPFQDAVPTSPQVLLPILAALPPQTESSVSREATQCTNSAEGHELLRQAPLCRPGCREQQPTPVLVRPSSSHPHVQPAISIDFQPQFSSSPMMPPSKSMTIAESVFSSHPNSHSPSFSQQSAEPRSQLTAAPLIDTNTSIRGSKLDAKSLKSDLSLGSRKQPTSQRAPLPPSTRIVRDAHGGVAFEFSTLSSLH